MKMRAAIYSHNASRDFSTSPLGTTLRDRTSALKTLSSFARRGRSPRTYPCSICSFPPLGSLPGDIYGASRNPIARNRDSPGRGDALGRRRSDCGSINRPLAGGSTISKENLAYRLFERDHQRSTDEAGRKFVEEARLALLHSTGRGSGRSANQEADGFSMSDGRLTPIRS